MGGGGDNLHHPIRGPNADFLPTSPLLAEFAGLEPATGYVLFDD